MNTMQAFRIHRFGGPEVMRLELVDVPETAASEVRVRIVAASLNPVDNKTRAGAYPLIREAQLPYILGRDFAGTVESVGTSVDDLRAGQPVYGFVGQGQGSFAEYVVVQRAALAAKPGTLGFREAAAVPLAGLTAWQGLFDHGRLQPGQRVLIHAAAGGVGHFAVQFAKVAGAEVIATASGDGVDFVRSLGADQVIDYKRDEFEHAMHDVDLVFDLVGGQTQERSWHVLRDGGAMISTLQEPSRELGAQHRVRTGRYTARPDGAQLTEIAGLIDRGQVRVHVAGSFAFDDAAEGEQQLEAGHSRGKWVLEVDPELAHEPH